MRHTKTRRARRSGVHPREQLSREAGTTIKNWGGRLPIALIYPNAYYLGMSNLGIHAIYRFLNNQANIVCERVFWETENQAKKSATFSLESQRPLSDFAVLAFSVSYELDYFNILPMLKASGIPVYATDRNERHPLIIAGGPCITANPAPLSPFFDCLGIGEAEPILPSMLSVLSAEIASRREDLLKNLASLPGVYVPQYHTETSVVRQWTKNLDDFPVTSVVLTPDTELGDLYLIEVERGCQWRCRFCLVSTIFPPMRFRSLEKLLELARGGLQYRRRIGLVGPDVSDYPYLEELLVNLRQMGAQFAISSLRISRLSDKLLREIVQGGIKTITLAPEAGSERLRRVLSKGIGEADVLTSMSRVAGLGIKQVKLYFMIGLPTETDEDIEAIIDLTLRCKEILDKKQSGTRLTLNIAPFVPKASTPFQRFPMASLATLKRRLSLLKNKLPAKGIELKSESFAWSEIQAVLARGDSKLVEVLANVEEVSLPGWRRAVAKANLDVDFYAHQEWGNKQELPWEMIELR